MNGLLNEQQKKKLLDQIETIYQHPLLKYGFENKAIVRNETEILDRNGNVFRIDRYSDLGDKIVLLDYKTGSKHASHYKQMQNYIALVKELESKPISGYLVYLSDSLEVLEVA